MKNLTSLLAILALVACVETHETTVAPTPKNDTTLAYAKAFMSEHLKDPESLKIRRVQQYRTAEGDDILCGEMDARNSFGGYNGYSAFYVRLQGKTVQRAFFDEDGHYAASSGCKDAQRGVITISS
ncbi:MAG: hypothetical protein ACU0BB_06060 [Paracoccaceae bacterium]